MKVKVWISSRGRENHIINSSVYLCEVILIGASRARLGKTSTTNLFRIVPPCRICLATATSIRRWHLQRSEEINRQGSTTAITLLSPKWLHVNLLTFLKVYLLQISFDCGLFSTTASSCITWMSHISPDWLHLILLLLPTMPLSMMAPSQTIHFIKLWRTSEIE